MQTRQASATPGAVPVTADNFIRAETDRTFTGLIKRGSFGKFEHFRELTPIDNHTVQRANRDTLYSMGVFDLDAWGWNYMVRLYRPRQEILDGAWKFPEATPVI